MYVASEGISWFDPDMLAVRDCEHIDDDHREIKRLVKEIMGRRIEARTLTNCPLNSRSVHDAINVIQRSTGNDGGSAAAPPIPTVGYRTERVLCPVDHTAGPFAHVACAGGTYAVVTEHLPQYLYLFDQRNDIRTSRLKLTSNDAACSSSLSAKTRDTENILFDEKDIVTALFLDPRGNFCVVRWRFGKAVYYYIPRCRCERKPLDDMTQEQEEEQEEEEEEEELRDGDMTPCRFPLQFHPSVTSTRQPFVIECIAWDPHNRSDETTGDIILGSSNGGIILACRLESHGIVAARRLYQFPQPYSRHPVDSVAYTVVPHSHAGETLRHYVVLIAQSNRLFVFAAPWGRGNTLDAAFDADRPDPHKMAMFSAFSRPHSQPLLGAADGTAGGDLTNCITVGGRAVGGPSPLSSSLGCHHRDLSSTAVEAPAKATRAASDTSSLRLFNHVSILEPRELLPFTIATTTTTTTATTAFTAAITKAAGRTEGDTDNDGGGGNQSASGPLVAGDNPPPVFCWRYGEVVTHGVVLVENPVDVSASKDSRAPYTSPSFGSRAESSATAQCPTMYASHGCAKELMTATHGLLPIGVLSVVNLGRCLRELSQLLQRAMERQAPMFRFESSSPPPPPPPAANASPSVSVASSSFKNSAFIATTKSNKTDNNNNNDNNRIRTALATTAEGNLVARGVQLQQLGLNDVEILSSIRRGISRAGTHILSPSVAAAAAAAVSSSTDTTTVRREESHQEEQQEEEKLASFAMGYGNFVVTTTHAVYAFCHLAALPMPQTAAEWKNRLVYFQQLAACRRGSGSLVDGTSAHATVFSSHNAGRSQCFSLFTSSYIVDLLLRPRRRRRVQYVAQLIDAVCPTRRVVANTTPSDDEDPDDDADDEVRKHLTASGVDASPFSTGAALTSPITASASLGRSVKQSLASSPMSALCNSPLSFRMQRLANTAPTALQSDFSSSTPIKHTAGDGALRFPPAMRLRADGVCIGSDTALLEELAMEYGSGAMSFPHIGTLGGHVEEGFYEPAYHDSDNLYGMALRLAALTSSAEERREVLPRVRHSYAACLFHQGRFLEAAVQDGLAFDGPPYLNALLVKFSRVAVDDMEPLILLILLRLRGYEQQRRGAGVYGVEVICLATWLISLLIERCNQPWKNGKGEGDTFAAPPPPPLPQDANNVTRTHRRSVEMTAYIRRKYNLCNPKQLLRRVLLQFHTFVEWNAIYAAVFGIANAELTIQLCDLLGRNEEVLSCSIIRPESPLDGLLRLERQSGCSVFVEGVTGAKILGGDPLRRAQHSNKRYWMQYTSLFMRHYPCRLVRRVLIPHGSELGLHPVQLFPALLLYEERDNETVLEADASVDVLLQRHAIEESLLDEERNRAPYHAARLYLEHAIQVERYTDECLLNLLLYFTVRDGDDAAITRFFGEFCTDSMTNRLEISYAHRLCCRFDRPIGRAWLCFISGRYCEAVQLAMQLRNEELALHFIRCIRGEDAARLRRALWKELAISAARNRQGGVRRALQLVVQSGDDVTVSDVLPHLSGDVMLQEFREELLMGVSSFCNTLAGLKGTINASIKDMEVLRCDMEATRQSQLTLPSTQECAVCGRAALTRPFVFFRVCGHVYHMTCFDARRTRLEEQLQCFDETTMLSPHGCEGQGWSTSGGDDDDDDDDRRECVLCGTRYLRLLLTALPLKDMNSDEFRLP